MSETAIWDAVSGKLRQVRELKMKLYDCGMVVQFTVVGTTHDWIMSIPLTQFRETNPTVKVEE